MALVHFHGAGGLRLTPAHALLSRKYRVVAFEMPGFGASADNTRTRDWRGRWPPPKPSASTAST